MFDPAALGAARAAASAQRRVAGWAAASLAPRQAALPNPSTARLSVREVKCVDPLCATPDGVEVLVTLTAEGWSATAKILQSAAKTTEVRWLHGKASNS